MSDNQERQIQEILESAGREPDERRCEFVRRACGSDAQLMQKVFLRLQGIARLPEIASSTPPVSDPPADKPAVDRAAPVPSPPSSDPAASYPIPKMLGPYCIEQILGRGGMGIVYRARDPKLCRDVAIKVILPGFRLDPSAVSRFDQEMQVIGQMDHPNVVRALHTLEVDGVSCLIMEYIDGITLEQHVKQREKISTLEACEYVRQAALGLEHAYQRGIVHRDVKPSNFIVSTTGVVKLLDLGIARLREAINLDQRLTSTEMAIGTVDFIAPEQQANMQDADTRSDIYSLGCTFYYCLTGSPPFKNHKSLRAKATAHRNEIPQPVSEFGIDASPEIVAIIEKMMAKSPNDRYQTPAAVAEALAEVLGRKRADPDPSSRPSKGDESNQTDTQPFPVRPPVVEPAVAPIGPDSVPLDVFFSKNCEVPEPVQPVIVPPRPPRKSWLLSGRTIGVAMLLVAVILLVAGSQIFRLRAGGSDIVATDVPNLPGTDDIASNGPRTAIGLVDAQRMIARYVNSLSPETAVRTRFFTLTHLNNDFRVPSGELKECRAALRETLALFLPEDVPPPKLVAIDEQATILALDTKLLHLEKSPGWQRLVVAYPYGLTYEDGSDDALAKTSTQIRSKLAGEPLACIRADWFIANCVARWDRAGRNAVAPNSAIRKVLARYMADLDLDRLACELDLLDPATGRPDADALSRRIFDNPRWRDDLKLGGLCRQQTISRKDLSEARPVISAYQEVARDLGRGLPVVAEPPVAALRQ